MNKQEINDILQEEATKLLPEVKVTLECEPPNYSIFQIIPKETYKHVFKYKNYVNKYEYEEIKELDRGHLIKEIVEPALKDLLIQETKSKPLRELLEQSAIEHKKVLEYLKDK